jgi:uncharacterized protein DUF4345
VLARIFLALSGLIWFVYGIYCFFDPGILQSAAGVVATTATGTIELRAMYGGLQAGVGALALAGALQPALVTPALLASSFLFAGLATTRALAAIDAAELSPYTMSGLSLEWGSLVLSIALLRARWRS